MGGSSGSPPIRLLVFVKVPPPVVSPPPLPETIVFVSDAVEPLYKYMPPPWEELPLTVQFMSVIEPSEGREAATISNVAVVAGNGAVG